MLRSRITPATARLFLAALAADEHTVAFSSPALLKRAIALDAQFADLGLGYADAAVMALAERQRLPVLTFDFQHFRAAPPAGGCWQLVIDEYRYEQHTRS